jgi:HAD superfamily hydrolase (TIGR01509 family)
VAGVQADLIIFDCDGVLVDSETLSTVTTARLLSELGFRIDAAGVVDRFLGHSLKQVLAVVGAEMGVPVPDGFIDRIRAEISAAFRRDLQPIPGIAGLLQTLHSSGRPRCVASSSTLDRIRLSLTLTGLLPWLEPHLFSATMVSHGKPAPDLFLHAASSLSTAPDRCLVIEDSVAGVSAARAAGMRVVGFVGGSHLDPISAADRLTRAGAYVIAPDVAALEALLAA